MSRTARLFQLMQSLRSLSPPVTAEVLASELSVSQRTIYRDIDSLRGLGAVIDGEAGFGYTLIEDASLPPLAFEDEELEALVLGLREVMAVGDPALAQAADSAFSKLRARLPDGQAHRLRHAVLSAQSFSPPPAPTVDARVLRRAAWEERRIAFDYIDAVAAQTHREVDPLSIVYMQMSHCLLAWCHLRQDYRAFRLDRMQNLTVLEQSFRPQRVPMLRIYLERMRAHSPGSC
ncbi:YafY family protein [Cognatishimia sp. SS12]|uniref:helix-turn-helix transcriptional regulator n=1 Tax=Cognatishimia sp. SS12 TaxID=2979465 RepID=UPI00232C4DD8|nr:YafY family protein [Cognatishimia sp. SS12]MDC0737619.1 YafY family protein [Cognatishimia sp. SS12]